MVPDEVAQDLPVRPALNRQEQEGLAIQDLYGFLTSWHTAPTSMPHHVKWASSAAYFLLAAVERLSRGDQADADDLALAASMAQPGFATRGSQQRLLGGLTWEGIADRVVFFT